jgi:hypothetical protein
MLLPGQNTLTMKANLFSELIPHPSRNRDCGVLKNACKDSNWHCEGFAGGMASSLSVIECCCYSCVKEVAHRLLPASLSQDSERTLTVYGLRYNALLVAQCGSIAVNMSLRGSILVWCPDLSSPQPCSVLMSFTQHNTRKRCGDIRYTRFRVGIRPSCLVGSMSTFDTLLRRHSQIHGHSSRA